MSDTPSATGGLQAATVVTGASSGIGRELARVAARERKPVLVIARSAEALTALVKELESAGAPAALLALDLRQPDAAAQIDAALARHGWFCDTLVLCAGIGHLGAFSADNRNEHLGVLDLNARVPTELALHFLPAMRARGRGALMLVGSIAGYAPGPNMAVYYATKAYVRSLSGALYAETKGSGVTVTNLSPGFVSTPFLSLSGLGATRLRKILPRMTAVEVAEQGWRGLREGRRLVVPGVSNRILIGLAKVLPTRVLLKVVQGLQHGPQDGGS